MSRAFVNEDAGNDRPDLPERPVPPGPNLVTPRGLDALKNDLAALQAERQALKTRPDRLDKLAEAAAERDIRWLEARLKAAVVIDPANHDLGEVAFGLSVTVSDPDGIETTYEITGEDEADATRPRIAPASPLARALLGTRVGDLVTWKRPVGNLDLEVTRITHADP